jgi:hypothetical protein
MIEKDEREEEETDEHRERRRVVRIGGENEALVLVVAQRSHGHARDGLERREAGTCVDGAKREDAVDVGQHELERVAAGALADWREEGAHVGVEHAKLELHVAGDERLPLALGAVPLRQRYFVSHLCCVLRVSQCVRVGN